MIPLTKLKMRMPQKGYYGRSMAHVCCEGGLELEGCRRVLNFQDGCLMVDMGRAILTFYGNGLMIRVLAGQRLLVQGQLNRMEMEPKKSR